VSRIWKVRRTAAHREFLAFKMAELTAVPIAGPIAGPMVVQTAVPIAGPTAELTGAQTAELTGAQTAGPMVVQTAAPFAEGSVLARLIAVDRDEFASQY
jgi:hypothetical protein